MIMKFNDLLALVLVVLIIGLWVAQGLGVVNLLGEIIGASIAVITLIAQYYFRKAPPPETPST